MPGHRFRITVEALSDRKGAPVEKTPLVFEVENHDDILDIVERIQGREDLAFGQEKAPRLPSG